MADPLRARGYSPILLGPGILAVAGRAATRTTCGPQRQAAGLRLCSVYAPGTLPLQDRPAEAYEPARQYAAAKALAWRASYRSPCVPDYEVVVLAVAVAFFAEGYRRC